MLKKISPIKKPVPTNLKSYLPVNYFLLTLPPANATSYSFPYAKSKFHETNHHELISYYKAISNIL